MRVSRGARRAATSACAALLLGIAACEQPATSTEDSSPGTVRLYGTDGNMINTFGDEFKEQAGHARRHEGHHPAHPAERGLQAAAPGVDPELGDYVYAAETYDAVVICALAAELAGTTDAVGDRPADQRRDHRRHGVRRHPRLPPARPAAARTSPTAASRSSAAASPTPASRPPPATRRCTSARPTGSTTARRSTSAPATSRRPPPSPRRARPSRTRARGRAGAPLIFGGLLPKTGDLALAYPPMGAAAALAIKEINAAGGVLGEDVVWRDGDDGTSPAVAKRTVSKHVDAGVSVIIGAGASSISRAVLPDVVGAGLILFSPCNTDAGLSTIDDKGLYFRTAPPDILQGKALADVIMRDGPQKITIVARKDSYGEGLQANVRTELERAGVPGRPDPAADVRAAGARRRPARLHRRGAGGQGLRGRRGAGHRLRRVGERHQGARRSGRADPPLIVHPGMARYREPSRPPGHTCRHERVRSISAHGQRSTERSEVRRESAMC